MKWDKVVQIWYRPCPVFGTTPIAILTLKTILELWADTLRDLIHEGGHDSGLGLPTDTEH